MGAVRGFFRGPVGQAIVFGGVLLILGGLALGVGSIARTLLLPPITVVATPSPTPVVVATVASSPTPAPSLPAATVTLAPSPTPSPAPAYVEYLVKYGDTLYSIARRYGTTPERIRAANGLASDTIRMGDVLLIPLAE